MSNEREDKHGGDSAALVRDLRHGSWTAQIEEMLHKAADRIEELERQRSASSSCAAIKEFVTVSSGKDGVWVHISDFNGGGYSINLDGVSGDFAEHAKRCADAYRNKLSAVPESGRTVDKSGEYDADLFDSGRDSMADDVLDILNVYRDQFTEDERIEKVRALCREQLVSAPYKDQPEGEGK